jgi:indole-3-glycerol phosphate synthase
VTVPTILDEILCWKRGEIARDKATVSLAAIRAEAALAPPTRDFAGALGTPGISLIAEIKRASPSKGVLRSDLDPVALARTYEANGAAAVSVLTDEHYFQGSLDDLRAVQKSIDLPVLRKDFILEPYQVYQARAAGADAVLLIVAALDDQALQALLHLAEGLGMAALVEVHNAAELKQALSTVVNHDRRLIGVNNRDLHTFAVDLGTTEKLRALVPSEAILVSESGIHSRSDVQRLEAMGADAILVGETLVRAQDAGTKVRELLR